ncbi:5-methylcytosine-specific restriction endonuclease system specificity protein McrC [Hymenobacter coalescens]
MVPIQNLYYLLCYAWNRLPEPGEWQQVATTDFHRPLELLTQMLLLGTRRLLAKGLPLGYTEREAELTELRGRVLLTPTLTRDLLRQGRAVCAYDELGPDTPFNRLLVGALEVLGRTRHLPAVLRQEVRRVRNRFPATVAATPLTRTELRAMRRLHLPGQEGFLLNVCDLIYRTALPDTDVAGRTRFHDFRRDEALMAGLFERFVRNFYRLEQRRYRVASETIHWQAEAERAEDLALLPSMITDTSLTAPDRRIILDTKYYAAALKPHHDRQRLIAPHLYQLFAYLQNQAPHAAAPLEGILLYPAATHEADLRYTLGGFPVRVVTIDLNQPWPGIAADLHRLVA